MKLFQAIKKVTALFIIFMLPLTQVSWGIELVLQDGKNQPTADPFAQTEGFVGPVAPAKDNQVIFPASFDPGTAAFQDQGGFFSIEAEHAQENVTRNGAGWTVQNTVAGFSGDGYFEAGPDRGLNFAANYAARSAELQFETYFETSGTFYVWVRGYAKDLKSDTLHIGLDGGASETADQVRFNKIGEWNWTRTTLTGPRASLSVATAGMHTLNVWMGEDGAIFDKIILTKDANYIPTGMGAEENVRIQPPVVSAAAFRETSGQLSMEAEHAQSLISRRNASWIQRDTRPGYSGEGFLLSTPDAGKKYVHPTQVEKGPEMQFETFFENSGTYYVWIRGLAKNEQSNTVHIGIDGAVPGSSDRIKFTVFNQFVWTKVTMDDARARLKVRTTGLHTINLWMGEDGVMIDKIILTQDPNFVPRNLGLNESGRYTPDVTPPTGSVQINSGNEYTNSLDVTLNLTGADNETGVGTVRFSSDGGANWSAWQDFAASKPLTLTAGEGERTVLVELRDIALNSTLFQDKIIVDTIAPQITVISPNPLPQNTLQSQLTVDYVVDGISKQKSFSLAGGDNILTIIETDLAGNQRVFSFAVNYKDVPIQPSLVRVVADDRRLFVRDRLPDGSLSAEYAYIAKGVNWEPASPATNPDANPNVFRSEAIKWYKQDFQMMQEMGVNVIRVYHDFGTDTAATAILDEAYRRGIKIIMTVDSPRHGVVADLANIAAVVQMYKNHPAILMWAVGNEWNYNNYYGKFATYEASAAFTEQAAQLIKSIDLNHPVTSVVGDPSDSRMPDIVNVRVPSVDVWGLNIYRGKSFGNATTLWKSISNKPAYIGEFGADSYDHRIGAENGDMQADMNSDLWIETYFDLSADRNNGALIGALAFEWNDEWWKNGTPGSQTITNEGNGGQPDGYNDEEWFGLVDINRNPKPVFYKLKDFFLNGAGAIPTTVTRVLEVRSAGGSVAQAALEVDGVFVYARAGGGSGGRGINVSVFNPGTGKYEGTRTFDTWASSGGWGGPHVNFQELIDYLNSLPDKAVVALSICDEGGFINPNSAGGNQPWSDSYVHNAYQVLEGFGSAQIRNILYNRPWAMVFVKGVGLIAETTPAPAGSSYAILDDVEVSIPIDLNYDHR